MVAAIVWQYTREDLIIKGVYVKQHCRPFHNGGRTEKEVIAREYMSLSFECLLGFRFQGSNEKHSGAMYRRVSKR